MKYIFTFFAALLLTASVFAQAPQKISYQAVIRNSSEALVTNQVVGMQISILQGFSAGTAVYAETQTSITNANGLVSIEIGSGTTTDNFSAIDWANGPYFIKTETDPTGGTNYTITGTSQLLSVPFALHAITAESVFNNNDTSSTNEWQVLSISNDTIFLVNGGNVKLPVGKLLADNNLDTRIQVEETADEDIIRFDIAGTERWIMNGARLEPKNTGGSVSLGENAGLSNTIGTGNVFLGQMAGMNSSTGNSNTYLGAWAGRYNVSGDYNVFVGYGAGYNETGSNKLYIDNNYLATSATAFMYGDFSSDELRINANVGIWSVPSATYELYVNGDLWSTTYSKSSDKRWKTNIYGLQNALEIVGKLRGVSFNWKVDDYPEKRFDNGTHAGFIAQEVEKILPALVKSDDKGFKSVEYTVIIPYLVESIKEQQKMIDKQKKEIERLKNEMEQYRSLEDRIKKLELESVTK